MMRNETLKHLHHHDPVPRDPVRRAGGVVEHQHRRHGADVLEHLEQPLAHALRVLPGQRHRVPHVRIRERRHQAVHVRPAPRNHGLSQTEIRLHHARRPLQLQIPVTGKPMLLPPALHVPLHDLVRTIEPLLLDQPVIHAPGRMPLLARHEPVCLQPLVDQRLVRVELRDRRRTGRGLRRAVLHLRVLAHRLSGHPDLLRYATPGHTPRVENPDTLLYGRWHRHVLSFPRYLRMVASTRESNKTGRANASPRRQHDHMVNFSPITRPTNPR